MEEKLIKKLIKLIALRDGAKAIESHEEANNAQQKIDTLLAQVNKTEDEVLLSNIEEEKDKPIDVTMKMYNIKDELVKTEGDWRPALMGMIARMNKCSMVIYGRTKDSPLAIIGDEFNIEVVIATYKHLVELIKANGNRRYREYSQTFSTSAHFEKKNTYIRGYLKGVPGGMRKWWDEYLETSKNQQTGLMKLGEIEKHNYAVGNYMNAKWGNRLGNKSQTKSTSVAGRSAGHSDGYSMGRQGGTSNRNIGM